MEKSEVNFATLTVLSKQSLGHEEEIFDFLLENGIRGIDLLPCVVPGVTESESLITPREFAKSVARIFDLWWQLDDPEVRVRLFENVLLGLLESKPNLCKFAGTCVTQCTLDYNGDIYPCDSFVGTSGFVFGNIAESDLADIVNGEARQRFVTQVQTLPNECLHCKWREGCNGGCTYHRYMRRGNLADKSSFCDFRKRFFPHVQKRLRTTQQLQRPRKGGEAGGDTGIWDQYPG